jgi:hypothetical protein
MEPQETTVRLYEHWQATASRGLLVSIFDNLWPLARIKGSTPQTTRGGHGPHYPSSPFSQFVSRSSDADEDLYRPFCDRIAPISVTVLPYEPYDGFATTEAKRVR